MARRAWQSIIRDRVPKRVLRAGRHEVLAAVNKHRFNVRAPGASAAIILKSVSVALE